MRRLNVDAGWGESRRKYLPLTPSLCPLDAAKHNKRTSTTVEQVLAQVLQQYFEARRSAPIANAAVELRVLTRFTPVVGQASRAMVGPRQVEQASFFEQFSLERHVPAGHLLRSIDRFFDLSALRRELAPLYSSTGRPSIDPELMLRMLLVGTCFCIRFERRLCDEMHLNLAYRWFCRLRLEGDVPDHSTFSKNPAVGQSSLRGTPKTDRRSPGSMSASSIEAHPGLGNYLSVNSTFEKG